MIAIIPISSVIGSNRDAKDAIFKDIFISSPFTSFLGQVQSKIPFCTCSKALLVILIHILPDIRGFLSDRQSDFGLV